MGTHLPEEDYRRVVESVPILCVDLIIKRDGRALLVRRTNQPLKGEWWVPGGRVRKDETIFEAARRKAWDEVGMVLLGIECIGIYEDNYPISSMGVPMHCVSVILTANGIGKVKLNSEADEFMWNTMLPTRLTAKTNWITLPIFRQRELS